MTTPEDDAAAVLSEFVPLSDHPVLDEMSEAIARDIAARGPVATDRLDPRILAGLEESRTEMLTATLEEVRHASLFVNVDYLELVDRYGEDESWIVLGKLKDLLG